MNQFLSEIHEKYTKIVNKEAIWLYAELFLGHVMVQCHGSLKIIMIKPSCWVPSISKISTIFSGTININSYFYNI